VQCGNEIANDAGRLVVAAGDNEVGQRSTRNRALQKHGAWAVLKDADGAASSKMQQGGK